MNNPEQVLQILEGARERVAKDWPDVCPSQAILAETCEQDLRLAAHVAFLRSAGVPLPLESSSFSYYNAVHRRVFDYSDAQTSAVPVVRAFDRAIAAVRDDPAPTVADLDRLVCA